MVFEGGYITSSPPIRAAGGVKAPLFILGRRCRCESSPLRRTACRETSRAAVPAVSRCTWKRDFLPKCPTGLRCYISGSPQCWRSCLNPPSDVPFPAPDGGPVYRPATAAPPPSTAEPCPLRWRSSMPLRTALLPASPRSARTARKPRVSRTWTSSWRRTLLSAATKKKPATSRFRVFSCLRPRGLRGVFLSHVVADVRQPSQQRSLTI